ncbi:hypothetical protein LUZ61_007053 [Rhynchospora tenuis]|uniref:PRA1 family protein n=1 Tax=Rhynchospora tenuis TaxID=198213 RepID=A0AAD6EW66_9POAL|nr:hypothetical protein LUZ61_007053 [Rhynchospora tenuis]
MSVMSVTRVRLPTSGDSPVLVTTEDLIEALREVDWSAPPRPISEFFSRFTTPKSLSKWESRLKCNLYYYRTNYFIIIVFILGMGFLRKPVAILAALLTGLGIALLNDSFAVAFSEKVTRTTRQFSPHLAAKLRPPAVPVVRGKKTTKRAIHICCQPRMIFVACFLPQLVVCSGSPQIVFWLFSGPYLLDCSPH